MLIFIGDTEADMRAAKLKALKAHFKESGEPRAINMLDEDALSDGKGKPGEKLVVNAHGNTDNFSGYAAKELFDTLRSKGLGSKRFESIYLMACNVGEQAQDNSIVANFARSFWQLINTTKATQGIKVYAPRGVLTYTLATRTDANTRQRWYEVTAITVNCPERNYPLSEGLLRIVA